MARVKKENQEFNDLVEAAFAGDRPDLAAIIQTTGFIHPDNGLKKKFFNGIMKRQQLDRWEKDGLEVIKIKRAKYYPIRSFIEFVLARSIKSRQMESDAAQDWKAKDAEFVAKKRQLGFEIEQGKYMPVEDIKRIWSEHIAAARTRLLAMPRALASRLQGETNRATIEKEIKTELYSALEELSE